VENSLEELIKRLKDSNPEIRQEAAEKLIEIGDEAVPYLIEALQEKSGWRIDFETSSRASLTLKEISSFRRTVAWVLGEIGDYRAINPLIETLRDENISVRNSAAKALVEIGEAAVDPLIALLKDWNKDIREAAIWALGEIGDAKVIETFNNTIKDKGVADSNAINSAIERIIEINRPLLESFPDLFCRKCFLETKIEDSFSPFSYVVCRGCGSSLHLIKDIKEVRGFIGGDIESFKINNGIAYVNLWFEHNKKTRSADIDVLEIRESYSSISYDWAINAVLNELKNDVSRPSDYVKHIPVIIKGNPPLSENSMKILKYEFRDIKSEKRLNSGERL